jgi:hypothetical protein
MVDFERRNYKYHCEGTEVLNISSTTILYKKSPNRSGGKALPTGNS